MFGLGAGRLEICIRACDGGEAEDRDKAPRCRRHLCAVPRCQSREDGSLFDKRDEKVHEYLVGEK
jgi:hypothetical protein